MRKEESLVTTYADGTPGSNFGVECLAGFEDAGGLLCCFCWVANALEESGELFLLLLGIWREAVPVWLERLFAQRKSWR